MPLDPRPAAGVRLFILDDEGVLFAPARQELHGLNAAATLIWCLLEEGLGVTQIAGRLAGIQRCDPRTAERLIRDLLEQWRDQGLLTGTEADGLAAAPEVGAPGVPAAELPPCPEAVPIAEHRYRLLDWEFRIRYATSEQEDWVHPVLRHLEIPNAAAPADETLELVAKGAETLVYRNRLPMRALPAIDHVTPYVKALLWLSVMEHDPLFLVFHAGVVGVAGRCILFPAAPGSGKSTLVAALARSGFSFFSDEIAPFAADRFAVRPVPLGICVKSTGWEVLTPLYPELAEARTHHRGDGKIVRYLAPPPGVGSDTFHPVGAIVFPRYAPDLETALRPLGKAEALHRLLQECLVVKQALDERNVARLVDWMKSAPCYELTISSLAAARDRVVEMTSTWS